MAAEQFAIMTQQKTPAFEMPNGDVLYVSYNKESDMIDVGPVTNAGIVAQHRFHTIIMLRWMPTCKL